MGLKDIFKFRKKSKVNPSNEFYRALYDIYQGNLQLNKDSNLSKYIEEGFEGNSDVFGIVMKLATKFAQVPVKLVQIQSDGSEKEIQKHEVLDLLKKPNHYQNRFEFMMGWALFKYVTGNTIVYTPKYKAGINRGKVDKDGMFLMPPQNMYITSKSWREPIGFYEFEIDVKHRIEAENVWHERFPSLTYVDGRNFMGTSPLKTALNIVNIQNAGLETAAKLYKGGHPPGILSKEDEGGNTTAEQESKFRSKWKTKYQKDIDIPIFTMGKISYTQIGYSNLKDLQMLEMDERGTKKLCVALGVPPEPFGAGKSIYNNMLEAKKAMYEDRIIPDLEQFWGGINEEILPAYGENLKFKPDYSGVEALQEDKEKKAKVYQIGMNVGAYSPDEFREKMGDEPTGKPEMQERYIGANRLPISMGSQEDDPEKNDDFFRNEGMPNAY